MDDPGVRRHRSGGPSRSRHRPRRPLLDRRNLQPAVGLEPPTARRISSRQMFPLFSLPPLKREPRSHNRAGDGAGVLARRRRLPVLDQSASLRPTVQTAPTSVLRGRPGGGCSTVGDRITHADRPDAVRARSTVELGAHASRSQALEQLLFHLLELGFGDDSRVT